ncbi:hypothetical protein V6N13_106444 [Hibiscus sabdariffa]
MIESLGIENAVKVFRAVANGPFKVLSFTDDNDVLNMVAELSRNRNVHLYLVEQDHVFVSEPNDEHEPQTNDVPGPVVSDFEFGTEPNIETNVESGTGPTDEPVGRDIDSGSEPNVESNAESGTDPNDEPVGSDTESGSESNDEHVDSDTESGTECEFGFEEDEFSADEEDDNETESVVHTPQFTEHASQFETHFEETRVVSDNETEYSDSLHNVDESDSEHSCRKKIFPEFNTQTDMVHPVLKVAVKKDFISHVHQSKLYRARDIAIGIIEGNHKDQYSRIYDNLGELRLSNPGTTTIYGCHLKGYHGGHLLNAIGIDANDCIYPITFAAAESECHSSWCWFVQLLGEDLDLNNSYHISFMSERQKVLCEHLYNNFKGKHKGKALKDSFWKVATSTYMREFQVALVEMESLSPQAFEWLKNVDPKFWSKSHFSTRSKCDMLLNNLCESFNKCVLEARSRPIITMLEGIRTKIMQRIAKKKAEADKWTGVLCPKIQKKLEAATEMSNR